MHSFAVTHSLNMFVGWMLKDSNHWHRTHISYPYPSVDCETQVLHTFRRVIVHDYISCIMQNCIWGSSIFVGNQSKNIFSFGNKSTNNAMNQNWHLHHQIVKAYQSKPSNRPSPFIAEVLKIAHWRFFILCNSNASVTAAASTAPGRSCRP